MSDTWGSNTWFGIALCCVYVFVNQVFCDFLPGTVFTDSSLCIRGRLGDGGFGTVFKATLHTGVSLEEEEGDGDGCG
jgi:hypothetical protein